MVAPWVFDCSISIGVVWSSLPWGCGCSNERGSRSVFERWCSSSCDSKSVLGRLERVRVGVVGSPIVVEREKAGSFWRDWRICLGWNLFVSSKTWESSQEEPEWIVESNANGFDGFAGCDLE